MITVLYHLRLEEKDQVIDSFEQRFESTEKRDEWEQKQKPHPFLTLKAIKVIDSESTSCKTAK